jgi:uncharacterized protein
MKTEILVKKLIFGLCLFLFSGLALHAQTYPEKPNPPRLVNDFAGLLAAPEAQALEGKLDAYNDSTSTQITIVTLNSLDGADPAQYATELAEKWGIGRKQKDNGVLILISKTDHQIFIATGRGVEEYLTDLVCNRIIENKIKPAFRAGNYYQGLNAATDEMIGRLQGTFKNNEDTGNNKGSIPGWVIILGIIFLLFVILPAIFGGGKGGGGSTLSSAGTMLWALGSMGSGGGSWGGGGGGGFGGFGGGSFGGGGAGGSW